MNKLTMNVGFAGIDWLSTAIVGGMFAILLTSCTVTPVASSTGAAEITNKTSSVDLRKTYLALEQGGGKLYTLAPSTSAVKIYAFRSGSAARLGHNHVLTAPQFTGFFFLPSNGTAGGQFDLEFRLDQLEIDNPAARANLGKAFATVPSPDAIEGTRQHMLGENGLQAERFPFVRIHSLTIVGESPKFAAKVQMELHGQRRELWIPLNVEGLPDNLSVTGSFVLRQSDFGVTPYSVLGGMLAVTDEVIVEFTLRGS
jgi:polyisoprenoid-binding protein YceI